MKKMMEYKGYYGTVDYSLEDEVLYGKVVGINSLFSYEGETIKALEDDFHVVIDEYSADCKVEGITPQKSKGGCLTFE